MPPTYFAAVVATTMLSHRPKRGVLPGSQTSNQLVPTVGEFQARETLVPILLSRVLVDSFRARWWWCFRAAKPNSSSLMELKTDGSALPRRRPAVAPSAYSTPTAQLISCRYENMLERRRCHGDQGPNYRLNRVAIPLRFSLRTSTNKSETRAFTGR